MCTQAVSRAILRPSLQDIRILTPSSKSSNAPTLGSTHAPTYPPTTHTHTHTHTGAYTHIHYVHVFKIKSPRPIQRNCVHFLEGHFLIRCQAIYVHTVRMHARAHTHTRAAIHTYILCAPSRKRPPPPSPAGLRTLSHSLPGDLRTRCARTRSPFP